MILQTALLSGLLWIAGPQTESPQEASAYRVLLLAPTSNDPVAREACARTRGELEAAGFEVTAQPLSIQLSMQQALEGASHQRDYLAAFAIAVGPAAANQWAEIGVWTRLSGSIVVERMPLGTLKTNQSMVLAVRAVEVLRAQIAGQWIHERLPQAPVAQPEPAPQQPLVAAPAPPRSPAWTWGLSASGTCLLQSALGTSWSPALGLSLQSEGGWGARLNVAGLGSQAEISNATGTARLSHGWLLAEVVRFARSPASIRPFLVAGLGLLHLSVQGTAVAPYQSTTSSAWTGLGSAGVGVHWRFQPHLALELSTRVFAAWPSLAVHLGGQPVGTADRPAFLVVLGFLGEP